MMSASMVFGPYLLCSFCELLPSASQYHGSGSVILGREIFRFQKMSMCWNLQDLPRQFVQAAPDRQVILTVYEATSGAASTGVTVLEAALEAAKTNRCSNRIIITLAYRPVVQCIS